MILISSYEMITVSSGPMNMQYSPSDYNKALTSPHIQIINV